MVLERLSFSDLSQPKPTYQGSLSRSLKRVEIANFQLGSLPTLSGHPASALKKLEFLKGNKSNVWSYNPKGYYQGMRFF